MNSIINIIVLLYMGILIGSDKTSAEIQQEINSRNNQIDLLKQEIITSEEKIIEKTKTEISESEILLELDNKISLIEQLIKSIDRDQKFIIRKIDESEIEIIKTEKAINDIQNKIKNNIIYSYKKGIPSLLELILNVEDLNNIAYKTKYLNTINKYQKDNKERLKTLILELKQEKKQLKRRLENKKKLKADKAIEQENFEQEILRKNKLLNKINQDKESEKKLLAAKKKDLKNIESIINQLYSDKKAQQLREKELAEIRKLQKMTINGNFQSMKGKLPWPIQGNISSKFGNKRNTKHNTITENLGVDIKSSKDKNVIAVLDGIVSSITYIRGVGNIIILDHGDGFNTVYSNIENIIIEENQYISAGSKIAEVNKTKMLHFQIWHNKQKKNPEKWLSK